MRDPGSAHHNPLTGTTTGPCWSLPQRVEMHPDYRWYPPPGETTAHTQPLFTVCRREFRHQRWRPCERSPTVLAKYSVSRIGGVSMAFRTATSRRAGAGILGTLAVLLAAALATG